VSLIKTNRAADGAAAISARAKDAAAAAVPAGKRAGATAVQGVRQGVQGAREWAGPRLEDAAQWAGPRLEDAVQGAREWAAPRLEGAADAVTTTVAPKVSSVLRSTAQQVRPDAKAGKTGLRRLLGWRWLFGVGALVAAVGATAAMAMRRRYNSATADAEYTDDPAPEDAPADEAGARAEVNGQVTAPRP
jgi:hypothetical protein